MYAKTQLAIAAEAEHERLVHHNLVTSCVLQIDVAHRDRDVTMDLDAVLGSVIIVPDLDPALKREARVFRKVRIAAHEVRNRTPPGATEGVLAKGQCRLEEDRALRVVIKCVDQSAGGGSVIWVVVTSDDRFAFANKLNKCYTRDRVTSTAARP